MEIPNTWVEELSQDPQNSDLMHVVVGVENYTPNWIFIKFTVSLSYMGLHWDDEFEFEFSKDVQRDMNKFFEEHKRIPTPEEYKALTERHLYS